MGGEAGMDVSRMLLLADLADDVGAVTVCLIFGVLVFVILLSLTSDDQPARDGTASNRLRHHREKLRLVLSHFVTDYKKNPVRFRDKWIGKKANLRVKVAKMTDGEDGRFLLTLQDTQKASRLAVSHFFAHQRQEGSLAQHR